MKKFNDFKQFNKELKDFPEKDFSTSNAFDNNREITHFSDSIVISFKINKIETLQFIINSILNTLVEILEYGIIVRGGVSMGKLIHEKDIAFGPAFIEAYHLESKDAKYPRIIFSKELVQTYDICRFDGLEQDFDGYYYLDYFNLQNFEYYGGNPTEDIVNHLRNLEKTIISGLKNDDEMVVEKYFWMKHNFLCSIVNIILWLEEQDGDYTDTVKKIKSIYEKIKGTQCIQNG